MYVLNEYMEFGIDTPHIATYNFKLVFHLLFSTIYSSFGKPNGVESNIKYYRKIVQKTVYSFETAIRT